MLICSNDIACVLDYKNIVLGCSILGKPHGGKGNANVGNCQNNQEDGKENEEMLGEHELFLHMKLLLNDVIDFLICKISKSFLVHVAHG